MHRDADARFCSHVQVYCLSWNMVRRNVFLSGSWDDTIKLWDLASNTSLATFKEHTYCVYAANWWAFCRLSGLRGALPGSEWAFGV